MDDFVLDGDDDDLVYMQCRICLEAWQVNTLADGVQLYTDHICREKS